MLFGPKFACLTFSDTNLKILTAKTGAKGVKVYYFAKKPLPEGIVLNGQIVDENLFNEALKAFFLENYDGLKTRNLVLGLNETEVFLTTVSFDKKPKNLTKAIEEKIAPKLPFDLTTSYLTYHEISERTYQVAAAKAEVLQQLTSLFEGAGFSLKAIVPTPLSFFKLVGPLRTPYLFVSQEEDLIYSLVGNNGIAFSSTARLKKQAIDNEKEIIKLAEEIIEEEYNPGKTEPLQNVFVLGKDAEFIKTFFDSQNFNAQGVNPPVRLSRQVQGDAADFSRCIALSFFDKTVFSFPKLANFKPKEVSRVPKESKKSNLKYLAIPLVIALAAALFLLWPTIKEFFFQNDGKYIEPTKVATNTSLPKQATPPADQSVATPSTQPKEQINKAGFKIQVLNGTGKVGAATNMRDFLVSKGYSVVGTGNADNFNYQLTIIRLKESKKEITEHLTKDLEERYAISVGSPLSEGESFDILIIVGGD